MKDGRCLRCWSNEHRAAACPAYTKPAPSPCRFCHYLYHPSDLCLYYDADGKSKPASRSTSAKWLDQVEPLVQDTQQTLEKSGYTFHIENYTNECNFAFFPELYDICPSSDSEIIYACAASSAVKKKFRFPATDPDENIIKDTRSDLEKISDIIRVWSQVLNPAEQSLWNEVAERNLSHDISLRGVRTPKALIDEEIKKFRNIKADKQKQLLQAVSSSEIVNPLSPGNDLPVPLPSVAHFPSCLVNSE